MVSTLFAVPRPGGARAGRPGQARTRASRPAAAQPSLRVAAGLVRDRRFRLLLIAAGGLALASVSDALIYVGLQRQIDFDPTVFPLLYVVTAVVFMVLAIPVGRLADRVGRVPVLLVGHALLLRRLRLLLLFSAGYGRV